MNATRRSRRLSIRTMIFLLSAVLVLLAVGLSIGISYFQGQGLADQAVDDAVARSQALRTDLQRLRARQLELIAQIFASDSYFTSYVAEATGSDVDLFAAPTGEVDQESIIDTGSIADLLAERRPDLGFDVAMVLDSEGVLLAHTARPVGTAESLADNPLIAELIESLVPVSGLWIEGGELYQAAMVPLAKNFDLLGFLVAGLRIDDALADEIKRATGTESLWVTANGLAASTLASLETEQVLTQLGVENGLLADILARQQPGGRVQVNLDGGAWIANIDAVGQAEQAVASVSLIDRDRVLANHRQLQRVLLASGGLTVIVALLLSLALARAVVRPVERLARAASAASRGEYQQHLAVGGADEVHRLGHAFESLLSDLREKQDIEEYVADLSRYLPDPAAEQSTRGEPAINQPKRLTLALLAVDLRSLATHAPAGEATASLRDIQSRLAQLADLAGQCNGSLDAVMGHRSVFSFGGEQAAQQAVQAAALMAVGVADQQPGMALVLGVVDRGMVRASASQGVIMIGKASGQLDLLVEEARPGTLFLSPQIKAEVTTLLAGYELQPMAHSGRMSGKRYYGLDHRALSKIEAHVTDRTRLREDTAVATMSAAGERAHGIAPGDLFAGRYEIISILGQGGMGMVYKALDRELEDFVALKTLLPEIADDSRYLEQLKEEIRLARKITQANVLRTFDFGREEGVAYISMEYVRGMTLRYLMRQRAHLPYSAGLRIARQLCAGLAAAHEQGVIHRDIKPENVILEANGKAKLMDFGIARPQQQLKSDEAQGLFIGTARYAAPEQMEGRAVDPRADVYACGVVMYEIFTGQVPYAETDLMDIYQAKVKQTASPPSVLRPEVSAELEQVINRCLAPSPAQRYADAEALGQALSGLRA